VVTSVDFVSGEIVSNSILANVATNGFAGGILFGAGYLDLFQQNVVVGNTATENGGGIYIVSYGYQVISNIVAYNSCGANGAGLYEKRGNAKHVENCFVGNIAGQRGGGAYVFDGDASHTQFKVTKNKSNTATAPG